MLTHTTSSECEDYIRTRVHRENYIFFCSSFQFLFSFETTKTQNYLITAFPPDPETSTTYEVKKELNIPINDTSSKMDANSFNQPSAAPGPQGPRVFFPILCYESAESAYVFALEASPEPLSAAIPNYNDGQAPGFHTDKCWRAMRERLWTGYALLIEGMSRWPSHALDVTEEEVEDCRHLGGFCCLCNCDVYECWMTLDSETGLPKLACALFPGAVLQYDIVDEEDIAQGESSEESDRDSTSDYQPEV